MEISENAKKLYGALIHERAGTGVYSGEMPTDQGKPDVVAKKDAAKYEGDRADLPHFKEKQAERDKLKYKDTPVDVKTVLNHTNASGSSPEMHY